MLVNYISLPNYGETACRIAFTGIRIHYQKYFLPQYRIILGACIKPMISKKKLLAVLVVIMGLLLSSCSLNSKKENAELSQEPSSIDASISSEESVESNNSTANSTVPSDLSQAETSTDSKGNSTGADKNNSDSQPALKPPAPVSKPSGGSARPNNSGSSGGSVNTPNGNSNEGSSTTTPTQHVHKWEKQPKGSVFDWENSCGPDENGYTTNVEIATNKDNKKVGIYMCVNCYKYYGSPSNNEWENRYWDHIEKPGPCCGVGYCTYPVYAIYEAYYCRECESWKRGKLSIYGYYDYSNGAEWIFLEPWQIKELNLAMP